MSAAPSMKDALKFDIEIIKGPHSGVKLSFSKASVSLGRGPENDIVLSSDPRVSRQHAEIKQRGNEFVLVNLSQKNFVMVNGQNVQSEPLTNDSVIQIGETEILFRAEVPEVRATPAPVAAAPPPPSFLTPNPVPTPVATPRPQQMPAYQQPRPMPSMPNPSMPPAQPMGYGGGYTPPPSGGMGGPTMGTMAPPPVGGGLLSNPKVRFYGIVAAIGFAAWFFLFSGDSKPKKDANAFRTSALSMADVAEAEKRSQELLTVKKEKYDSIQYRRAQENFIKGFRDFQQGQYARAREAFQVVLNLDPDNELAKRYFHLSKIKFDELVKFNMIQGNRYREKKNWRMCQSNYSNVMTMLQHRKDDPSFKEAKQYYEECTLNLEGRY
ncbi:FHA domain-containing protein [Bdellovibrio sp.]|uniref:FHA domain-containing protein n=1 Tax=Bdellovibrio sp. TaxID=28201 RepID=UPI003221451B